MQLHTHPHVLAHAEADARRRLGVPSERDLALLARRERAPKAPPRGARAALAGALASSARRLHGLAEALDPTAGKGQATRTSRIVS